MKKTIGFLTGVAIMTVGTTGMATGVVHQHGMIQGAGAQVLFAQSWRSESAPRAALVIVHGLKDHSARYAGLAQALVAQGVAVHAFDLRGHGRSAGERVWVGEFEEYLQDLDVIVSRVQAEHPGLPLYLMGHSMGGAIATRFTLSRRPELAGLILTDAALSMRDDLMTRVQLKITPVIARLFPHAPVFALPASKFSHDPQVVRENHRTDPLIHHAGAPARTAVELLSAIRSIGKDMESLELPLLVMHAELDVITNPAGSQELVQRARSTDKTLQILPGYYHDIFHESEAIDGGRAVREVVEWMQARL